MCSGIIETVVIYWAKKLQDRNIVNWSFEPDTFGYIRIHSDTFGYIRIHSVDIHTYRASDLVLEFSDIYIS